MQFRLYTMSQEDRSIFWEVIVSVILRKTVYVIVSYYERFPRYSYFTVQYTVHCTDEQYAMSSHELQSALMLKVIILGKLNQLCHLNNQYRH
jgi:hypothetical protein